MNLGRRWPAVALRRLGRGSVPTQRTCGRWYAAAAPPLHLPSDQEEPQLRQLRHTLSHILAQAVQALFTDAQVTLGPWTGDGFYYDFALPEPFAEADLKRIKKEMDRIIKRRLPLSCEEVSASEARRRLEERGEGYKLQILDRIGERARPLSH
jgi:threonyl-tRNA synthetase